MSDLKERFITFILIIFIIAVFGVMGIFCLDFLGIIKVPEEYSLLNLFSTTNEVIAKVEPVYKNTINPTNNANSNTNKNTSTIVEIPVENKKENAQLLINEVSNPSITQTSLEDAGKFYYNQLDEYGKIIYNELYNHKENLKTGTYTIDFDKTFNELLHQENGDQVLNTAFQLAVNSFMFDNPDVFYLEIPKLYLLTEITVKTFSETYRVSIGANEGNYLYDEFYDVRNFNIALNDINEMTKFVLSNAMGTDYDKVKYVHDYLINNVEYEKNNNSSVYTIYGTLTHKKAVCEGYAKTFKYLLDELGIPCIIVCGIGRNSEGDTENHAWNYVQLNGQWYAVDTTWDDPIIIGNGFVTDDIKYRYFLKGSNLFFEDHLEDGAIIDGASFKYPKLSVINY